MAPQEVGDRCIITPSGYAVHSSRLGLLWITLLSCALAIRAPFLIRLSIIIRALIGYSGNSMSLDSLHYLDLLRPRKTCFLETGNGVVFGSGDVLTTISLSNCGVDRFCLFVTSSSASCSRARLPFNVMTRGCWFAF